MESNTKLHDDVLELSYKLESLSERFEDAVAAATEKREKEADPEALLHNAEQVAELRRCLEEMQTKHVAQTERVLKLEQQQQTSQDAQVQQVSEALEAVQGVSSCLAVIEKGSKRELQDDVAVEQGLLQEALADVQTACIEVKADLKVIQNVSDSNIEIQNKCLQDIADLSLQVEQVKDRLEKLQPTSHADEEKSTAVAAALQERMLELVTDIESYQKRSENVQNSSNAKLKELTDAVTTLQELAAKHVEKLVELEATSENRDAAASSLASEQRAQAEHALELMKEQLSVLTEAIGNTKAESAELREIVSSERKQSSQMKDDMLTDKLALEERLETVEEKLEGLGLVQPQQQLTGVPCEAESATSLPEVAQTGASGSHALCPKWTDDLERLQRQLGERIDELNARVEQVALHADAFSGEVDNTSINYQHLKEDVILIQNAFLELQADSKGALSLPEAEALSCQISALQKQFEEMKGSYIPLVAEEKTDAEELATIVAQVAAAQQATSVAFDAFKMAISERLSEAISMSQLEEVKATMDSEFQSIRSLLHSTSSEPVVCLPCVFLIHHIAKLPCTNRHLNVPFVPFL
jgi:chromosome segregation ATPase